MLRKSITCFAAFMLLISASAYASTKSPQGPIQITPEVINCPIGPAGLCIPLDNSFTTVVFNGPGGSGEANPLDPCQRNDDDVTLAVALPFAFNLYGTIYNSCFINNNGNISFGSSFAAYTPSGFPISGFPMVAPLWSDVDTRNTLSGVVHYKLTASRLVVIWDHVGYYNVHADKLNTFELIISDGNDPLVGIGNNVCFCYNDMQWTTGDASGGVGGFGGTPATAGVNKGDGVNFFQIGRFDHAGFDYDGPGGANDGVDFLDQRVFCFRAAADSGNNIPPVPQGFPVQDSLTVCVGDSLLFPTGFTSPELGQTTTTVVNLFGLANASVTSIPGNPSQQLLQFAPTLAQVGPHVVRYTATDDGSPPQTTIVDLTLYVVRCDTPTKHTSWGAIKSIYR
jgi:hypothetical protein